MAEFNLIKVDLKTLAEPVKKLIDTIGGAAGIVYEPTRIRQKASAEADAAIILARNQADVREIEIRATERLQIRELRRQQNIENIATKAIDALPDSVSPAPVDEDWIYQLIDHCKDIGNEQMQTLWAKLLAGEVAKPGSFSYRTLRVVRELRKDDAELFTRFCTFVWTDSIGELWPITPGVSDLATRISCVRFDDVLHLESLGLISLDVVGGFQVEEASPYILSYYGKEHRITLPPPVKMLSIGNTAFSGIGRELAPIAGGMPSEEYRKSVVQWWQKHKYSVEILGE